MASQTVAIFGATQGIGRECVAQALQRGVHVRAMARNPSMLQDLQQQFPLLLTIIKGDAMKLDDVKSVLTADCSCVISTLGGAKNVPNSLVTDANRNIIEAMKVVNVKKIVLVTSAGTENFMHSSVLTFSL